MYQMRGRLIVDIEDLANGEEISVWRRRKDEHQREEHRPGVFWFLGPVRDLADAPDVVEQHHHHHPRMEGPPDMSFTLKDNQEVNFAVAGTDSRGNPTSLTGTPAFSVSDPAILALTDNGDGSGSVAAVGPTGSAILSVTDAETNGKQFIGSIGVDVVAGDVASVAISLSQPTDIPAAVPPPADGGTTPPADTPPADTPPAGVPPADAPPADGGTTPPADAPPAGDLPQVNG